MAKLKKKSKIKPFIRLVFFTLVIAGFAYFSYEYITVQQAPVGHPLEVKTAVYDETNITIKPVIYPKEKEIVIEYEIESTQEPDLVATPFADNMVLSDSSGQPFKVVKKSDDKVSEYQRRGSVTYSGELKLPTVLTVQFVIFEMHSFSWNVMENSFEKSRQTQSLR